MPRGAAVIRYEGKRGVVWRIKYADAQGVQVQETLGRQSDGWSRKKAESELRERLVRVERKGYRRPKPIALAEYAPRWLREREAKNNLKPRSVDAYRNAIDRLLRKLGPMPLGAIRPRHLSDYIHDQLEAGYDPTTVNYDISLMHAILKTANGEELVDGNPATVVERPKNRARKWRILEAVEIARVVREFADERARLVFLTAVQTGLRRHELRNLRWRDVSHLDSTLHVRESKSEHGRRTIALPRLLADALWEYRLRSPFKGDDEYVFAHPHRGSRLDADWFADQFEAARKRAGIEGYVRPLHDLRHTMITHEAAINPNEFAIKTKAGHKSLTMTQEYVHLAGQVFHDEAAALEKRFGGATLYSTLYPPERISDDFSEPEPPREAASDAR